MQQLSRSAMPLVRIAVPKGKSPDFHRAISQGVQTALVETFDVPQEDLFQIMSEHAAGREIVHASSYLGNEYSDALTFFFQAEDGIRGADVTGVQTCALPI